MLATATSVVAFAWARIAHSLACTTRKSSFAIFCPTGRLNMRGGAEVVHNPSGWALGSSNILLGGKPLQSSSPSVSTGAVLRFDDGNRDTLAARRCLMSGTNSIQQGTSRNMSQQCEKIKDRCFGCFTLYNSRAFSRRSSKEEPLSRKKCTCL